MTSGSGSPALTTSYFDSLLSRIRAGDESAKAELIRDAFQRAYRLTRVILRGERRDIPHGLTDHVHSLAYEKFARRIDSGKIAKLDGIKQLFHYLGKIIRSTAIDESRRQMGLKERIQFPKAAFDEAMHRDESFAATGAERRLGFQALIEMLSDEDQQLVSMIYEYDYSDREIAAEYGVSRQTIARWKIEVHLKLKTMLEGEN